MHPLEEIVRRLDEETDARAALARRFARNLRRACLKLRRGSKERALETAQLVAHEVFRKAKNANVQDRMIRTLRETEEKSFWPAEGPAIADLVVEPRPRSSADHLQSELLRAVFAATMSHMEPGWAAVDLLDLVGEELNPNRGPERASKALLDTIALLPAEGAGDAFIVHAARGELDFVLSYARQGLPQDHVHSTMKYQALHAAVEFGHLDTAKLLVALGADVDVRGGPEHRSPLFMAAFTKRWGACRWLLSAGASKTLKDRSGLSAYQAAAAHSDPEVRHHAALLTDPPQRVVSVTVAAVSTEWLEMVWSEPLRNYPEERFKSYLVEWRQVFPRPIFAEHSRYLAERVSAPPRGGAGGGNSEGRGRDRLGGPGGAGGQVAQETIIDANGDRKSENGRRENSLGINVANVAATRPGTSCGNEAGGGGGGGGGGGTAAAPPPPVSGSPGRPHTSGAETFAWVPGPGSLSNRDDPRYWSGQEVPTWPWRIPGLVPAMQYKIRVSAKTLAGLGPASREVLLATKPAPPSAPPCAPVMVSATPTSITVGWVPPMYENGPPIITYEVQRRLLPPPEAVAEAAAAAAAVVVAAAAATTVAPASTTANASEKEEEDDKEGGRGEEEEVEDRQDGGHTPGGGAAHKEAEGKAKAGAWVGIHAKGLSPYCTAGGLPNYNWAEFRVRARNMVGWGPWSVVSAPLEAQDIVAVVSRGPRYMVLRWFNKPEAQVLEWELARRVFKYGTDFRGDDDDSWEVLSRAIPGVPGGGESSFRCEGLAPGIEYQFRLLSCSQGSGWQCRDTAVISSPFRTVCAPPEPPSQPHGRQLNEDPLVTGGATAKAAAVAAAAAAVAAAAAAAVASGLPEVEQAERGTGQGKVLQEEAEVMGKGLGEGEVEGGGLGGGVRLGPARGSSSLMLEWEPGCPNGAAVTEYELWGKQDTDTDNDSPSQGPDSHHWHPCSKQPGGGGDGTDADAGWWLCSQTGARPEAVVVGLLPATRYLFRVRARNLHGWGDFSPPTAPLVLNPLPPCSPPRVLERGVTWLRLGWEPPMGAGLVLGFELHRCCWGAGLSAGDEHWELEDMVIAKVDSGGDQGNPGLVAMVAVVEATVLPGLAGCSQGLLESNEVLIGDLRPGAMYRFKVRCSTLFGWSPMSQPSGVLMTDRRF